eukprot:4457894-Alexandrium_andersonii.AAC.1
MKVPENVHTLVQSAFRQLRKCMFLLLRRALVAGHVQVATAFFAFLAGGDDGKSDFANPKRTARSRMRRSSAISSICRLKHGGAACRLTLILSQHDRMQRFSLCFLNRSPPRGSCNIGKRFLVAPTDPWEGATWRLRRMGASGQETAGNLTGNRPKLRSAQTEFERFGVWNSFRRF